QIKSESFPDGSWVWYDYDTQGRVITEIRPFKGGPALTNSVTQTDALVTTYDYTQWSTAPNHAFTDPSNPGSTLYDNQDLARPRIATEGRNGTVLSRHVFGYACAGYSGTEPCDN